MLKECCRNFYFDQGRRSRKCNGNTKLALLNSPLTAVASSFPSITNLYAESSSAAAAARRPGARCLHLNMH